MTPRSIRFLSISLLATVLAACHTPPAATSTAQAPHPQTTRPHMPKQADFQRTWMLVAMPGFKRDELVKHKAQTDWSNLPKANANMGCNQMGYSVALTPNATSEWQAVNISPVFSTRMACPDMRLEQAFGQLIPTMTQAKVEGHRLTLRNLSQQTMEFVAADWD